jgi:hypothetical protein
MRTSAHMPTVARIASLNDALRDDPEAFGHVLFDPEVMAAIDTDMPRKLGPVVMAQHALLRLVRDCAYFTGSDRDRAERRCGRFTFRDRPLGFAIDYRDATSTGPARDAADPATTRRILTIRVLDEQAPAASTPFRVGRTPADASFPAPPSARDDPSDSRFVAADRGVR